MNEEWYSGLRVEERRPFTPADRDAIEHLRRTLTRRSTSAIVSVPLCLLVLVVLAWFFDFRDALRIASPAVALLLMGFRPWSAAPTAAAQLQSLKRDEEIGEVIVCRGVGRELIFKMNEQRRLTPEILTRVACDEPLTIELLPQSGAILTINGTAASSWHAMYKGATAPQSEHAQAAALWIQQNLSEDGRAVGERAMSAEERTELLEHAPPVTQLDLILNAAVVLLAVVSWYYTFAMKSFTLLLPIGTSIAAVLLSKHTIIRWRSYRRFAMDIAHGRVIIVYQANDAGGITIEYLPHSGFLWTTDLRPATWRRLPLNGKTFVRRDHGN
ncbi:MAG: hypothetical protein QOK37_4739 [Thermoanaerobaculia bacterium]|jgi:hypothetical protein|nr:hypothetical protein [Thermoanaerobaculia bacterium]